MRQISQADNFRPTRFGKASAGFCKGGMSHPHCRLADIHGLQHTPLRQRTDPPSKELVQHLLYEMMELCQPNDRERHAPFLYNALRGVLRLEVSKRDAVHACDRNID